MFFTAHALSISAHYLVRFREEPDNIPGPWNMAEHILQSILRLCVAALLGWTSLLAYPTHFSGDEWGADGFWGDFDMVSVTTGIESPGVTDYETRSGKERRHAEEFRGLTPPRAAADAVPIAAPGGAGRPLYDLLKVYRL
jgi:hypothetical protein